MLHRIVKPAAAKGIKPTVHNRHSLCVILLFFLIVSLLHKRSPGSRAPKPVYTHGLIHIPGPAPVRGKELQRNIRDGGIVIKIRQICHHLPVKHQGCRRVTRCLVNNLLRGDHAAALVGTHGMLGQSLSLYLNLCAVKAKRTAWIRLLL